MKKFKKIMAVLVAAMMIVAMAVPAWAATITISQSPSGGTAGDESYSIYKIFDATKTSNTVGNTTTIEDRYTKVQEDPITSNDVFDTAKAAHGDKLYYQDTTTKKFIEVTNHATAGDVVYYYYDNDEGIVYTINSSTNSLWFNLLNTNAGNVWVTLAQTTVANIYNVEWQQDYSIASAKEFAQWLKTNMPSGVSPTYTMKTSDAAKTVDDGYYLITSSLGSELILATATINIQTKNEYPTTEKKVNGGELANYNMGDYVPFTISVNVPASAHRDSNHKITVHDTMAPSLSLQKTKGTGTNQWNATVTTTGDFNDHVTLVESGSFDANHDGDKHKTTTGETLFDFVIDISTLPAGEQTITIAYYAELMRAAAINDAIVNKEYIEYSKYKSNDDNATVKTFGFQLKKQFAGSANEDANLSATFNVARTSFIKDNANGTYYKKKSTGVYTNAAPDANWVTTELLEANDYEAENDAPVKYTLGSKQSALLFKKEAASETYKQKDSTASDAVAAIVAKDDLATNIQGLSEGIYAVTETLTSNGYKRLTADVIIQIDSEGNAYYVSGPDEGSFSAGSNKENLVTINNKTDAALPATGGMGTTVLYIVGGMLVILAGAYLFFSRKKTA